VSEPLVAEDAGRATRRATGRATGPEGYVAMEEKTPEQRRRKLAQLNAAWRRLCDKMERMHRRFGAVVLAFFVPPTLNIQLFTPLNESFSESFDRVVELLDAARRVYQGELSLNPSRMFSEASAVFNRAFNVAVGDATEGRGQNEDVVGVCDALRRLGVEDDVVDQTSECLRRADRFGELDNVKRRMRARLSSALKSFNDLGGDDVDDEGAFERGYNRGSADATQKATTKWRRRVEIAEEEASESRAMKSALRASQDEVGRYWAKYGPLPGDRKTRGSRLLI